MGSVRVEALELMAGWLVGEAWTAGGELRHMELLALVAMADFARLDGRAWPSVSQLAERIRVSVSTARRLLRRLESEGLLESEGAGTGGRGKATTYRVLPSVPVPESVMGRLEKPGQRSDRLSGYPQRRKPGQSGDRLSRENPVKSTPKPGQVRATFGPKPGQSSDRPTLLRKGNVERAAAPPRSAEAARGSAALTPDEIERADAWLQEHPADRDRLELVARAECAVVPASARERTAKARLRQLALAELRKPESQLVRARPYGELPGSAGRGYVDRGLQPISAPPPRPAPPPQNGTDG